MLKTVEISRAKKTAGIAVTYRAGKNKMFGTCPASCNLNDSGKGAENVDSEYLDALLNAKPKKGFSFTYSSALPHVVNFQHNNYFPLTFLYLDFQVNT